MSGGTHHKAWEWRNATREQMQRHIWNLHCQLSLMTALLASRDEEMEDGGTPTSKQVRTDAEALMNTVPVKSREMAA
jgi:hypothetical protein